MARSIHISFILTFWSGLARNRYLCFKGKIDFLQCRFSLEWMLRFMLLKIANRRYPHHCYSDKGSEDTDVNRACNFL